MAPAHDVTTWLAAHLTWLGLTLLLHWLDHAHHLSLLLSLIRDRWEHGACIIQLVVLAHWLDLYTGAKVGISATGGIDRSIVAVGLHHRPARVIWAKGGVMWLVGSAQKIIDGILPSLTVIVC